MTSEISITEKLAVRRCPVCAMLFATPESWMKDRESRFNRKEQPNNWYCPAGHSIVFTGDTELDRVTRERDRLKQDEAYWAQRVNDENRRAKKAEGEIRRQAKRSAAGVCSACNRTFQNMARHMHTKHPELVELNGRAHGGHARAASLSPERRADIAKKAAAARWAPKALEFKP